MTKPDQAFFTRHVPAIEVRTDADSCTTYGSDWTHLKPPAPCAVAFPRSTAELQQLVLLAKSAGLAIVPSGGRTGLSGGAVAGDGELVISMEKMRAIEPINMVDATLQVEAGAITATIQEHAATAGFFYGVDFASTGSSQIGGNIATNAGGIRVLRYGMTREQVLGLEVVTGNGDVLQLNRGLLKNATGYDLRHLLIGSEGTLGIITRATLKLWPKPALRQVMLLALPDHQSVMPLFRAARQALTLSAFEFFSDACVTQVRQHADLPPPFESPAPFYALLEYDQIDEADIMRWFEQAMDNGWLTDGIISQSNEQANQLWQYRERISESIASQKPYKNDIAVVTSSVSALLDELDTLIQQHYPDFDVLWYGHIGDGNLHMNVLKPADMELAVFKAQCEQVNEHVFAAIQRHAGSISAEHGVGLLKQPYLNYSRSLEEISLLKAIKQQFDPAGVLNPGKLL